MLNLYVGVIISPIQRISGQMTLRATLSLSLNHLVKKPLKRVRFNIHQQCKTTMSQPNQAPDSIRTKVQVKSTSVHPCKLSYLTTQPGSWTLKLNLLISSNRSSKASHNHKNQRVTEPDTSIAQTHYLTLRHWNEKPHGSFKTPFPQTTKHLLVLHPFFKELLDSSCFYILSPEYHFHKLCLTR